MEGSAHMISLQEMFRHSSSFGDSWKAEKVISVNGAERTSQIFFSNHSLWGMQWDVWLQKFVKGFILQTFAKSLFTGKWWVVLWKCCKMQGLWRHIFTSKTTVPSTIWERTRTSNSLLFFFVVLSFRVIFICVYDSIMIIQLHGSLFNISLINSI